MTQRTPQEWIFMPQSWHDAMKEALEKKGREAFLDAYGALVHFSNPDDADDCAEWETWTARASETFGSLYAMDVAERAHGMTPDETMLMGVIECRLRDLSCAAMDEALKARDAAGFENAHNTFVCFCEPYSKSRAAAWEERINRAGKTFGLPYAQQRADWAFSVTPNDAVLKRRAGGLFCSLSGACQAIHDAPPSRNAPSSKAAAAPSPGF